MLSSSSCVSTVRSVDEIRNALRSASERNLTVVPRGSGFSYGDAATNSGNLVLDMSAMNRILAWDPESGVIDVEPGGTVGQLCRHVECDGWWPPVVPGTQAPTIGGCIAANVHGKNNWRQGTIGEHLEEIELICADGTIRNIGPGNETELLGAVTGGFGLLGVISKIRMRMQPSSGVLRVDRFAASNLEAVMETLSRWSANADYVVGWLDGFAMGAQLGRGLTQIAYALPAQSAGESRSKQYVHPGEHTVLSNVSRLVRSNAWPALVPLANSVALKRFNAFQYLAGLFWTGSTVIESRRRFDFFHDLLPNWNRAFRSGIVQYQMFVPRESAAATFKKALEKVHDSGFAPFLAVMKLHRRDSFLLSEGVDGFSLSMDFQANRIHSMQDTLRHLTDEIVLPVGGRFYLAKDSVLTREQVTRSFGPEAIESFLAAKKRLDPDERFSSDLYRRLLAVTVA